MNKPQLMRRLTYLFTTERFFVYVFSALLVYVLLAYPFPSVVLLLYGLGVVTYLLFQGQRYWQLKRDRLRGTPIPKTTPWAFFRQSKGINQWLVGFMPLVCLLQLQLLGWPTTAEKGLLLAVLTNGFGVLEYVNYYHRQLMIDTGADVQYLRRHHKLKVASLAKDLAEQKS
jgi:hypothetical protein